jgi:hypothetical protein
MCRNSPLSLFTLTHPMFFKIKWWKELQILKSSQLDFFFSATLFTQMKGIMALNKG